MIEKSFSLDLKDENYWEKSEKIRQAINTIDDKLEEIRDANYKSDDIRANENMKTINKLL